MSGRIETKKFKNGVHIYERPTTTDILITCEQEKFPIYFSRFANKTFDKIVHSYELNKTIDTDITSEDLIEYNENVNYSSFQVIPIISIIFNLVLAAIAVHFLRKNRKVSHNETLTLNSIKL